MIHLPVKKADKKKMSGFSLVEMLVYMAILLIVSTASIYLMLSLNRFIDQYRLETMLYRSGTGVMEQVLLAIRQADMVDIIETIEDDPLNGHLAVENTATSTEFEIDSGELQFKINGVEYGDLTSDAVTVDGFTVYYYPGASSEYVRVKLELTGTLDDGSTKSMTFYGGAVVRGAI